MKFCVLWGSPNSKKRGRRANSLRKATVPKEQLAPSFTKFWTARLNERYANFLWMACVIADKNVHMRIVTTKCRAASVSAVKKWICCSVPCQGQEVLQHCNCRELLYFLPRRGNICGHLSLFPLYTSNLSPNVSLCISTLPLGFLADLFCPGKKYEKKLFRRQNGAVSDRSETNQNLIYWQTKIYFRQITDKPDLENPTEPTQDRSWITISNT